MKIYIIHQFSKAYWLRKLTVKELPLDAGIIISWSNYTFSLCGEDWYFPKGRKEGDHKFSISFFLLYFYFHIIIYKPKQITQP